MYGNSAVSPTCIRSITVPFPKATFGDICSACGFAGDTLPLEDLFSGVVNPKLSHKRFLSLLTIAIAAYGVESVQFKFDFMYGHRRDAAKVAVTVSKPDFSITVANHPNGPRLTIGVGYHGRRSAGPSATGLLGIMKALELDPMDPLPGRPTGEATASLQQSEVRDSEGFPIFVLVGSKLGLVHFTFYPDLVEQVLGPFAVVTPSPFEGGSHAVRSVNSAKRPGGGSVSRPRSRTRRIGGKKVPRARRKATGRRG